MTISSETRKAGPTIGNGVATAFPFAFKVFDVTDVVVTLAVLATGALTTLVLNTDYTLVLNADQNANPGGTVTYNPAAGAMTASSSLTISSAVPNLQGTDLTSGGAFLPEVIENMVDKAVVCVQQLVEASNRSIKFSITDLAPTTTLPPAAERANKLLSFDASGNPQVYAPADQSATALALALASPTGGSYIGFTKPDGSTTTLDHLSLITGSSLIGFTKPDGSSSDLSQLATTAGASMIGYSDAATYPAGTTGKQLQKIGTLALGAQAAGTTVLVSVDKTFSGHVGGTSDVRNWVMKTTFNGASNAVQVANFSPQVEFQHTAGTLTFGYGIQGFNRLGLAANPAWAGAITACRGVEWHTANESAGAINTAMDFYAQDVDLLNGTGTIGTMIGFLAGNQGHATRVTAAAIGFDCGDMTAGAPLTTAYRSQMVSGTNKWGFYASGSAKNAFTGATRVGDTTAPTDALEVKGFSKLTQDGTITASGTYHELVSTRADYVAHVRNTHATTPEGLRIRFTGASPNNTTQHALLFEDATTSRCIIWSNGNLVNTNNSYGAISDAKLKRDIRDAGSQWDDIKALRLRKYKLLIDGEDAREHLGLVAQEAEKVSPGLVEESPDMEDYFEQEYEPAKVGEPPIPLIGKGETLSRPTGTTTKHVKYSILYLKATRALQEAMERLETLERKFAQLEGK